MKRYLLLFLLLPTHAYALDETPAGMYNVAVDSGLVTQIQEALPEQSNVNAAFLDDSYNPNVSLFEDASLSLTFIDEGAGYKNSLGYLSYPTGTFDSYFKSDIDVSSNGKVSLSELGNIPNVELGLVFPNASESGGGGSLLLGDTVDLNGGATFSAGTDVSFFLGANTWQSWSETVKGWDGVSDGNSSYYYSIDYLNPEAGNSADINTDSSTNDSRHVAMLFPSEENQETVILGFEDLKRPWGDNDFNDAVFYITATPNTALEELEIYTAPAIYPAPVPQIGSGLGGIIGLLLIYLFRRYHVAL